MLKVYSELSFDPFFERKDGKIRVSKKDAIRLYKKLYEQNAVAEVLPLKQGLKHCKSYDVLVSTFPVAEALPLKQGLKLLILK